ncbi:MAG: TSUP family transporter [Alphaproteobacteria bacterium]|nr:TSUP family transporter [Alphaproteobacteria bacterium]
MDWTIYWFMFPVSICVATTAMLSGIGGAALFIPIFVIIFPILGPEYPLQTAAAIGTALMTEVFGFSSGFIGYHRKRLIDFKSAVPFLMWSVPVAIIGAVLLGYLHEQDTFLKGAYAILMIVLCPIILRHSAPAENGSAPDSSDKSETQDREVRSVTDRTGRTYTYRALKVGGLGAATTSTGAFLTGLLGVGIGEVIMPQLVKRNHFPVAVAAATSVFMVIVTIAVASFTQVTALIAAGGVNAIPWNLVCYTIPAVIIGGQIGPWLQGRIAQRTMEKAIAGLFGIIGVAMMWIVLK